jgi:RNA polymerase sigma factor (sigma-70 family)
MKKQVELVVGLPSLLRRLKNLDDQESWTTFYHTYAATIYGAATRAGLSHVEAEDIIQETFSGIADKIQHRRLRAPRNCFKSWLLRQAAWRVKRQLRMLERESPFPDPAESSTPDAPELELLSQPASRELEESWDREWQEDLLTNAFSRIKRKVNRKNYRIFDLLFFKQRPVREVARTVHVSRARVYLACHRTVRLLKKELAYLRASDL